MKSIRILLCDDQALFRDGLRMLLSLQPDFEIVGEAEDGDAAIQAAVRLKPDILLMDLRMPGMSGIEATRRVRSSCEQTRVIVLTTFREDEEIFESLRAGACGYLLKDIPADQLADAIRTANQGGTYLEPGVASRVIKEFSRLSGQPAQRSLLDSYQFSTRELDVLRQVSRGRTNKEISTALHISEGTVKNHLTSVFSRLGVQDRTQAALKARELGVT
ncbi:MAG: response regulator transcription factor [Akkermansiaceae bacterium]|jgi:DNA-binding NarL/FixJ family response regulator|nr:response regulator transcription factor [Akkermansiaceae bacterium]